MRLWVEAPKDLSDAAQAATREECPERPDAIAPALRKAGQVPAETVLRDMDDFMTFCDFPQEHWRQLRTTNPIEPISFRVTLCTGLTNRLPSRENALHLLLEIVQRLPQDWRWVGGSDLCHLALEGKRFVNRKLVTVAAA